MITVKELPFVAVKRVPIPQRVRKYDAAWDMYVPEDTWVGVELTKIDMGIITSIPIGYAGKIYLRSSWQMRGLCQPSTSIIDTGYDGPIHLLVYAPWEDVFIERWSRVAQMTLEPVSLAQAVDAPLSKLKYPKGTYRRGGQGFGSSGRKEIKLKDGESIQQQHGSVETSEEPS